MEDFPLLPVTANNGALERAVKIEMSDSICLAACKNLFPSLFTPGFFMTMSAFSKSSMRCSPSTKRILGNAVNFSIDGFNSSSDFKSVTVTCAPCRAKNSAFAEPPPFKPSPITVTERSFILSKDICIAAIIAKRAAEGNMKRVMKNCKEQAIVSALFNS